MNQTAENLTPERESTDDSLRLEREKTDRELAKKRHAAEQKTDAVVDETREIADELVQHAREEADRETAHHASLRLIRLEEDRAVEDQRLQTQRELADERLKRERAEQKRALEDLLRAERSETDEQLLHERIRTDEALGARDELLAMVSHDLRSLLGSMALTAETLAKAPSDGSPTVDVRGRAQLLQRTIARMNRIIGDLLDAASVESGHFVVRPSTQDMIPVVAEAVVTFQAAAEARGIRIIVDQPPMEALALLDRDRVSQVMANLLSNAIKFTPRGGTVQVRIEPDDACVRVVVNDTGPGVPCEHLEAIFGRFWQVGQSDRRGLGLGLYIARCIVDAHGGRIWCESNPGAGATFRFEIPRAGPRAG